MEWGLVESAVRRPPKLSRAAATMLDHLSRVAKQIIDEDQGAPLLLPARLSLHHRSTISEAVVLVAAEIATVSANR
jgi:hypothetical protein